MGAGEAPGVSSLVKFLAAGVA
eukprot:COSAG06_NODE_35845_length_455_cov_0.438202_2_plen_21_part_01